MAHAVARLLMACAVAALAASCEMGIDGDLQGSEIHGADAQVDDEPGDAADLETPDAAEEPGLDAAVDIPDAGHSRPDAGASHPDAGQFRPDASQPHPDAGAKGLRIASFSVSPTQIAQGGSVKVATTITSFGGATLSGGVLEVPSTGPDGVVRAGTTSGIDLGANETKVVEQTRGAYQMVGAWKFHATLKDSAGKTLAAGPAAGVSFTVVASPTVEVIILQNQYTGTLGVPATESAMDQANASNWIPGVKFHYTTSATINASTLSGKDVLVMPGGSSGYDYFYNSGISGADVRSFVHSGNGYVGTCAGAYAAVANVDGYGYGWGVAPNVKAKAVSYAGQLSVHITAAGSPLLGVPVGDIQMHHWGGAAMYTTGPAVVWATYAGTATGYQGYGAIVADTYGSGRTVLSGPHPELTPDQHLTFVARMIAWAAKRIP